MLKLLPLKYPLNMPLYSNNNTENRSFKHFHQPADSVSFGLKGLKLNKKLREHIKAEKQKQLEQKKALDAFNKLRASFEKPLPESIEKKIAAELPEFSIPAVKKGVEAAYNIRNLENEHIVLINDSGEIKTFSRGSKSGCGLSNRDYNQISLPVDVHNHPEYDSTFSATDLFTSLNHCPSIRVVSTPTSLYIVMIPEKIDKSKICKKIAAANELYENRRQLVIKNYNLSNEQQQTYLFNYANRLTKALMQDIGFVYRVIKWQD